MSAIPHAQELRPSFRDVPLPDWAQFAEGHVAINGRSPERPMNDACVT